MPEPRRTRPQRQAKIEAQARITAQQTNAPQSGKLGTGTPGAVKEEKLPTAVRREPAHHPGAPLPAAAHRDPHRENQKAAAAAIAQPPAPVLAARTPVIAAALPKVAPKALVAAVVPAALAAQPAKPAAVAKEGQEEGPDAYPPPSKVGFSCFVLQVMFGISPCKTCLL